MLSFIVNAVGQKWNLRSSHGGSSEADSIFTFPFVNTQHFTQNCFTYEPKYCDKLNSKGSQDASKWLIIVFYSTAACH